MANLVNEKSIQMDSIEGREALFEYANEGILVSNSNGEIIRVNTSAEKMFGYERDELLHKKIEVLIPQRFKNNHLTYRENFHQNPKARSMGIGRDLYGKRKDGSEFPVEISLSPFTAKDRNYVIAFIIDISIRKKNEESINNQKEELEKLTKKLQETNFELELRVKDRTLILQEALNELERNREELKNSLEKEKELNELKSRFVSMASHEFRTPLATILSSLSLATKYAEQGEKEKHTKHIERIKTSITHMTDLMNDVLSISKLEEGKINLNNEMFSFPDFSRNVINELKFLCKKNQELIYKHNGSTNIKLDSKIIKNIYFNLISNAIKFSPENKNILINTNVNNNEIIIEIIDEGIGISEDDKKHLFERFFRGQNATNIQGTGLGLNIVVKYVELMGGKITFESELEKGSSFKINIPNSSTN
ncbi:MAG: ATP-binding protein [Bacteroidota bacterium]